MHLTGSVTVRRAATRAPDQPPGVDPANIVPYVGAAVATTRYEFRQDGDFVDFATENLALGTFTIFTDTFKSEGWAPSAHAFGGADIQVYKRLYLSLEGRYTWVHAALDQDFIDFEPMDLGGFRFGAGLNFVF